MFGPLMHTVKSLEAESIIPAGHCTGTVKRKLIKLNCSGIYWAIFACPGRAGPGRFLGLTHVKLYFDVVP